MKNLAFTLKHNSRSDFEKVPNLLYVSKADALEMARILLKLKSEDVLSSAKYVLIDKGETLYSDETEIDYPSSEGYRLWLSIGVVQYIAEYDSGSQVFCDVAKIIDGKIVVCEHKEICNEEIVNAETHTVVCWPESQNYMERHDFHEEAFLILTERGVKLYGDSAYMIPKLWVNEKWASIDEGTAA